MKFQFTMLIANSLKDRMRLVKVEYGLNSPEYNSLSDALNSLEPFRVGKSYIGYSGMSSSNKNLVKVCANILTTSCAKSIRKRFLALGFDNYTQDVKKLTPIIFRELLHRKMFTAKCLESKGFNAIEALQISISKLDSSTLILNTVGKKPYENKKLDVTSVVTPTVTSTVTKPFRDLTIPECMLIVKDLEKSGFELTPFAHTYLLMIRRLELLYNSSVMVDEKSKTFGFKPSPFKLNDEVITGVFQEDKVIERNTSIMMMASYCFIYKKSIDLGKRIPVERNGIDADDLFTAGAIGFLTATLLWNPDYMDVGRCKFTTYGWIFARRYFRSTLLKSRLVRFPSHIEEKITKVHVKIRERRQILMCQKPQIDPLAIDSIIANELKTEIAEVRKYFEMFSSPSSALGCNLPTEQKIMRLDNPFGHNNDLTLINLIKDETSDSFEDIVIKDLIYHLNNSISTLSFQEQTVIMLRFGLKPRPFVWQRSNFKMHSDLDWKDIPTKEHTLQEIANYSNLSRERVRQIEAKALRKLRAPLRNEALRDFIRPSNAEPQINWERIREQTVIYEKLHNELDKILFQKLTGELPNSKNLKLISKFLDISTLKPFDTVSKLIVHILHVLYFRMSGLYCFENRTEFAIEWVPQTLLSLGYDIESDPTFGNATGLLTFISALIYDMRNNPHGLDYYQSADLIKAIKYLQNNPYILVNCIR